MGEERSVCEELGDQEEPGGGTQPVPFPSLRVGRRPDPDPLAIPPRASLQHLCPGTERGTGARRELGDGLSPREELPGMRCCQQELCLLRSRGLPSALHQPSVPGKAFRDVGKRSPELGFSGKIPATTWKRTAGVKPGAARSALRCRRASVSAGVFPRGSGAAEGHRRLGPSRGSSKIIGGFCLNLQVPESCEVKISVSLEESQISNFKALKNER